MQKEFNFSKKNKQLITIFKTKINDTEINSVNARDLWEFLESKQDFSNWVKNKLNKGMFIKNRDYCINKNVDALSVEKGRIDYILSIDTAKHFALMENINHL